MNRKQLQTLFTIVIVVSLAVVAVFLFIWGGKVWLKTYKPITGEFKIGYPKGWSVTENKDGAAVIFNSPREGALDSFGENVNVVVQDISKNPLTLEEYSELAIQQIQAVFGDTLEIIESHPTFFSSRAGYKLVYIGKGGVSDIEIMHVWTVKDNTAYQVTYSAVTSSFDRFLPQVEKMIASFRIR